MSEIKGKVVAITGASSGIGEATALLLAQKARTSSSARGAPTGSSHWFPLFEPQAGLRSIGRSM